MHSVSVQIVRFTDRAHPGWVECVLRDTAGREWTLADKAPIFTEVALDERSEYPQPGVLACEIVRQWTDASGRVRCVIDTARPWGVSTKDGETQFEVFADQITTKIPCMTIPQIWNRMLTRPAPRRPLRQLFLTTALSFVLGLIVGPFVPPSWAFDSVPIRLDLPFRVAAYGGLGSFVGLGALLLAPTARKIFIILILAMLPVVLAAGVAAFYPIFSSPTIDFDALVRIIPIVWSVVYVAGAVMLLGAGAGWFRYFQALSRRERIA